jgi:transcriptional regulator with XRE-family HTH domain
VRVTSYRVEHRLTQTELARMLGMRRPHIARLEAGEHEPSLTMLSRLARVLGMEFPRDTQRDKSKQTAA